MRLPADDLKQTDSLLAELHGDALSGKSIFITGGTGFVGRWLVETFASFNASHDAGSSLTILTRNARRFRESAPHLANDPAVGIIEGNLRALGDGRIAGAPSHCDLMIHGATDSAQVLAAGPPGTFVDAVADVRAALDFAVRSGAGRFLYLSSGAMYGPQREELARIPEEYTGAPNPSEASSVYGETKRAGELLCASYLRSAGLQTVIARLFSFIGPHLPLDDKFAAGSFLRDAIEGRSIRVHGDGTAIRSYMYAADLAVWLWVLLTQAEPGRPYNVGAEEFVSIADLAMEAGALTDPPVPVEIRGEAVPGTLPARYVPSTARIRSELGLSERTDWRTALRKTYAWCRERMAAQPPENIG